MIYPCYNGQRKIHYNIFWNAMLLDSAVNRNSLLDPKNRKRNLQLFISEPRDLPF